MKFAGAFIDAQKYAAWQALAKRHRRTQADQCRHLFDQALQGKFDHVTADSHPPEARVTRKAKPKTGKGSRSQKPEASNQ